MRLPANYFLPPSPSDLEETPLFNVVIVYEDFDSGRNARRVHDFLAEQLGHDCQLSTHMWKLEVLGIPNLRDLAVRDATAADIIIVAYHGGNPLPWEFKSWTALWSTHNHHPLALVALYDTQDGFEKDAAKNRDYLAMLASRAGMEFFSQAESAPIPQSRRIPGALQPNARGIAPRVIAAQHESAIPRWGINE